MKVTSFDRLAEYARKHPDAKQALASWALMVRRADWSNLAETRNTYPHADTVRLSRQRTVTVCNIRGNNYRLLTAIDYRLGSVHILDLLTHAEYDKEKWKKTV